MSTFLIVLSIVSSSGDNASLALSPSDLDFSSICRFLPEKSESVKTNPDFAFDVCRDSRFVPLREFVRMDNSDFHYTSVWSENAAAPYGFWHLGELARVAKSQINGTVPLLRYMKYNRNNRFSTKHLTDGWQPYTDANYVQTYIFAEPKEGTFGLYAFHKDRIQRLALDYNIMALENLGWVKGDLLGYVYRPCPSPLLS